VLLSKNQIIVSKPNHSFQKLHIIHTIFQKKKFLKESLKVYRTIKGNGEGEGQSAETNDECYYWQI
jgi:hypothetical protein